MQLIATDNNRVVVGLGMTGLSCARYLAANDLPFSLVDSREALAAADAFRAEFPNVSLTLGPLNDAMFSGANEIIVSPGVALDEPALQRAAAAGANICGDIDLFRRQARAPIVGITGSNGKTTVTTLLGEMAVAAGKCAPVGGNIGVPALELLAEPKPDFYILELSSFQLERAIQLDLDVATVLNISADHMDRYNSLVDYHQAKHRICFGAKQVVINRDDALSKPLVPDEVKRWTFGLNQPDFKGFGLIVEGGEEFIAYQFETLMPVSELKMAGRHNVANALAALALGHAIGLDFAPMLQTLKTFNGLEHRCQWVACRDAVDFYNDSKGTNVGATLSAINGLQRESGQLILIAGGTAKGADFSPLAPAVAKHCRVVILIGEAAEELATSLVNTAVVLLQADDMNAAVAEAFAQAQAGDAVLLSPACASFDMFDDYQQRGQVFTLAAQTLAKEGGNE